MSIAAFDGNLATGFIASYFKKLTEVFDDIDKKEIVELLRLTQEAWVEGRQVFFCGNGGSAANAMHLVNDFNYGIVKGLNLKPLKARDLVANTSLLTCLANDTSYDEIFSQQLATHAQKGDLLIVLSGSGNSPNILAALEQAKNLGMIRIGLLGYDGGKAKALVNHVVHIPIQDMQVSEDLQLVIGHIMAQWLYEQLARSKTQGIASVVETSKEPGLEGKL